MQQAKIDQFRETVWDYYAHNARSMPWRDNTDPYWVWVSEMMLQQTQVGRVIPKFNEFIQRFRSVKNLADAPLAEVLTYWSGLGYNRRAKYLHEGAKMIIGIDQGLFPRTVDELVKLPGVGPNTAAAIAAYAYNEPVVFIETNIRTVLLHHFFENTNAVTDKEMLQVATEVLEKEDPRQWYWALMDYGSHLKNTRGGLLMQSAHYKKQSPLKGSMREMRGKIIKALTSEAYDEPSLRKAVTADERFELALQALVAEGFVNIDKRGVIYLTGSTVSSHNRVTS